MLGFLGVYGKTKDTPEARQDQQRVKGREVLHSDHYQGPVSYALTKEEKKISFECLNSIKVPYGFHHKGAWLFSATNLDGIRNSRQEKFFARRM